MIEINYFRLLSFRSNLLKSSEARISPTLSLCNCILSKADANESCCFLVGLAINNQVNQSLNTFL